MNSTMKTNVYATAKTTHVNPVQLEVGAKSMSVRTLLLRCAIPTSPETYVGSVEYSLKKYIDVRAS